MRMSYILTNTFERSCCVLFSLFLHIIMPVILFSIACFLWQMPGNGCNLEKLQRVNSPKQEPECWHWTPLSPRSPPSDPPTHSRISTSVNFHQYTGGIVPCNVYIAYVVLIELSGFGWGGGVCLHFNIWKGCLWNKNIEAVPPIITSLAFVLHTKIYS